MHCNLSTANEIKYTVPPTHSTLLCSLGFPASFVCQASSIQLGVHTQGAALHFSRMKTMHLLTSAMEQR